MVRLDDSKYTSMTRTQKIKYLDKLKAKAEQQIEDQTFLNELIDQYKTKIDTEKAKL